MNNQSPFYPFFIKVSRIFIILGATAIAFSQPVSARQIDTKPPETPPAEPTTIPAMEHQPPAETEYFTDLFPPQNPIVSYDSELAVSDSYPLTAPEKGANLSFNDDLVGVAFEAGSFSEATQLQFTLTSQEKLQTASSDLIAEPGLEPLVGFRLEAVSAAAAELETAEPLPFKKQGRLIVDLRSLLPENHEDGEYFLAYEDPETSGRWLPVAITVHDKAGLLSADVSHFSNWIAGKAPTPWQPNWQQPGVSEFSGAATYGYPIELPPGRGGLQPNLAVSYSSRGLDGAIHDPDAGFIAHGWTLGTEISIVRTGIEIKMCVCTPPPPPEPPPPKYAELHHPDEFRLVFNGAGHKLYPENPAATATAATMRYYVEDSPSMRVTRYYDETIPNLEKIYWIVETGDGSKYRLGYEQEAEETQTVQNAWNIIIHGHRGLDTGSNTDFSPKNRSGIKWHVDTVTDAFGNQMVYKYSQSTKSQTNDFPLMKLRTLKDTLTEIQYNFPSQVATLPAPKNVAQLQNPGTIIKISAKAQIAGNGEWEFHQPIYIFHGADSVSNQENIAEYRLITRGEYHDSPGCKKHGGRVAHLSTTVVLDQIQRFSGTDNDPNTVDSGVASLPATNFAYALKPHFINNGQTCFNFMYLEEVDNGYGGEFTFTYQSDNRIVGQYKEHSNGLEYPKIGFNYFVTNIEHDDGIGNVSHVTYSYNTPCYDQTGSNVGTLPGATTCSSPDAEEYGNIWGFAQTTKTIQDYSGNDDARTIATFSQAVGAAIGRPTIVQTGRMNNSLFQLADQTVNSYQSVTFDPNNAVNFTYLSEKEYTMWDELGSAMAGKTKYFYETAKQGGTQYGNLTRVEEYASPQANFPIHRSTETFYNPNVAGDNWIVVKPVLEKIHDGDPIESTKMRETWFYYDGDTNISGLPPTKGELTRQRALVSIPCSQYPGGSSSNCIRAFKMIITEYAYDSAFRGNLIKTTTYPGYQYAQFDINWNLITPIIDNKGTGRETIIGYDAAYRLYPISLKNDLNQETTFKIYGFNQPLLGFQETTGLLHSSTDVGNNRSTYYEYDEFGRLWAVYDDINDWIIDTNRWNDNPISRYRYRDDRQPFQIITMSRPQTTLGTAYAYQDAVYYDGFGRPIQSQSLNNEVDGIANRQDLVATTHYNALGQVDCVTVPYAKTHVDPPVASGYDAAPCVSKPHTATEYDHAGRTTKVTDPAGNVSATVYAIETSTGRLRINPIDANRHRVQLMQDIFGQVTQVDEATGNCGGYFNDYPCGGAYNTPWATYAITHYSYDALGNLTQVTDEENNVTTITYDNFGRKISMDDPDMGVWNYEYDAVGNLIRQEANPADPDANILCFYYDSLDRLTRKIEDDSPATACPAPNNAPASGNYHLATYSYDTAANGVGALAELSWGPDPTEDKDSFTYDSKGRLTSQTRTIDNIPFTMSTAAYDVWNRPTQILYPNGDTIDIGYDREGENSLSLNNVSLVDHLRYNELGQLVKLDRNGANDTAFDYFPATGAPNSGNNAFRLKEITHHIANDAAFPDYQYQYDPVGNITQIHTAAGANSETENYSYDHLNRLTAVSGAYNRAYAYDTLGNLTQLGNDSLGYLNPNHPHAVTKLNGNSNAFGYDVHGNMISRTDATGTFNQTFDAENRLTQVNKAGTGGGNTFFEYDADGMRALTIRPDGTKIYTPFPGYEEERRSGGVVIKRATYILGGQAIAAKVSGDPDPADNGTFFIYSDHLGSVRYLANGTNVVANSYAKYYPFGDWRVEPTAGLTDEGYTGHSHNNLGGGADDLGLVYMNARYYLPGIGRFASADTIVPNPANPQSLNRYSYVSNNPIILTDPTGHCGADFRLEKRTVYYDNYNGTPIAIDFPVTDTDAYDECIGIRDSLQERYGISIEGRWTLWEMEQFEAALRHGERRLADVGVGNPQSALADMMGGATFKRHRGKYYDCGGVTSRGCASQGAFGSTVYLPDSTFYDVSVMSNGKYPVPRDQVAIFATIFHEIAHVWDYQYNRDLRKGSAFNQLGASQSGEEFAWAFADWMLGERSSPRTKGTSHHHGTETTYLTIQRWVEALYVDQGK